MNTPFYISLIGQSIRFFLLESSLSLRKTLAFWHDAVTDREVDTALAKVDEVWNHVCNPEADNVVQLEQDADEFWEIFSGQAPHAALELQYVDSPRQVA